MRADKINLGGRQPSIDLPELAWREIERSIGLKKPCAELRHRVAHLTTLYFSSGPSSDAWDPFPDVRPRDWRCALAELDEYATGLADYLDGRDELLQSTSNQARTY